MNSLRKLLLAKSILAAAVASSGVAAPVVSHAIPVAGSAFAGMVCRTGYTAAFTNGTTLKCSKAGSFDVALECNNPNFPVYVVRRGGPSGVGFDGDSDICIRNNGTVITINQTLEGLPVSTNGISGVYELAKVNPATVANRINSQDVAEAAALVLDASQVDTFAGTAELRPNGRAGGQGEARVPVTFFTFAVSAPPIIIGNPGPILNVPGTVTTSTTPFVPKALPR